MTRPGSVLTRASQIPERMCDLKPFFSGLRLREESTVSWTTIRVNSEIDLKGKLEDVEGELRDHGIQLFLLPIQDCRTKVIGIIPQMPSNSDLAFYKEWLLRRLAAAMGEEVQIALYLRTPWIGREFPRAQTPEVLEENDPRRDADALCRRSVHEAQANHQGLGV